MFFFFYFLINLDWASRANPYLANYAPQQQQPTGQYQQQQYIMAQPPPVISPFMLNAQKQVDTRFKSKALKLVSPNVRKYMQDVVPQSLLDPDQNEKSQLLRLKKLEHHPQLQQQQQQHERRPFSALRGTSNQRYRNRGVELKEELLEEIQQNQTLSQQNGNTNRTGLNIHRFRPGGIRRRQFKIATDDSASSTNASSTVPTTTTSTD